MSVSLQQEDGVVGFEVTKNRKRSGKAVNSQSHLNAHAGHDLDEAWRTTRWSSALQGRREDGQDSTRRDELLIEQASSGDWQCSHVWTQGIAFRGSDTRRKQDTCATFFSVSRRTPRSTSLVRVKD